MRHTHMREEADGRLAAITDAGAFAIEVIRLNREPCNRFRRRRSQAAERIRRCKEQLEGLDATSEIRALLTSILTDLEAEFIDFYYDPAAIF